MTTHFLHIFRSPIFYSRKLCVLFNALRSTEAFLQSSGWWTSIHFATYYKLLVTGFGPYLKMIPANQLKMQIYSFSVWKCQCEYTGPALTSKFESAVATERWGSSKKHFKTVITVTNSNQFIKTLKFFLSCQPFPFHLPTPPAPEGHTDDSQESFRNGGGDGARPPCSGSTTAAAASTPYLKLHYLCAVGNRPQAGMKNHEEHRWHTGIKFTWNSLQPHMCQFKALSSALPAYQQRYLFLIGTGPSIPCVSKTLSWL